MSFDAEFADDPSSELDPRDELFEVTRALRAHVEYMLQGGAFGVPKADPPAAASITEPPPSFAPAAMPIPTAAAALAAVTGALPQRQPQRPISAASAHEFAIAEVSPLARALAPVVASAPRVAPVELSPDEKHQRLTLLANRIVGCTKCPLFERRTQTVFARGTGSSGLCFIGEGPGADEDAQGFPFVGAAGQLLDKMIGAMGLVRDEVYVCNIVKCRPPENRKPLPHEMASCKPYLEEQLEILAPQVIVALGATAVEGLLGGNFGGITRLRGNWKLYKGRIAVMPTFHPAYLLRAPMAKHVVWEDMQAVLRHLGRSVPNRGKK